MENRGEYSAVNYVAGSGLVPNAASARMALDTGSCKTISYLHEDYRLLQGPDRSAGGVPADGPCRTGAAVRRRASRSWGLSPRPASRSAERGRHRLAARLSAEGLLRADRL